MHCLGIKVEVGHFGLVEHKKRHTSLFNDGCRRSDEHMSREGCAIDGLCEVLVF